jgi:hypothetical protein
MILGEEVDDVDALLRRVGFVGIEYPDLTA